MTRYAAYYCEENVWHLAGEKRFEGLDCRVVLISNARRSVAMWAQRAATTSDGPVVWDYHVVLLSRLDGQWWVHDLDTRLDCPCPVADYLDATFPRLAPGYSELSPRFRILDANRYRRDFSSDRSHMRRADGNWRHQPPSWPAIVVEGRGSFLEWTSLKEGDDGLALGELRDLLA